MVFSQLKQPSDSYLLWRRFHYPQHAGGPVDAVAVPSIVHEQLNSAYTLMAAAIILNIWAIVIGFGMYFYLRKNQGHVKDHFNYISDVSLTVWNKRSSLPDALLDTFLYASRDEVETWWFWPLVIVMIAIWAATLGAGILIPGHLVIGNGAPVNPYSIYVPFQGYNLTDMRLAAVYALDVPAALRAAGAALVADDDLKSKISVSQPINLGQYSANESYLRIEYGYSVSGADMGLQRFPDLLLTVTGACTTDYTWFNQSLTDQLSPPYTNADYYNPWNTRSQKYVSLFDGPPPTAQYIPGQPDPGLKSNRSWGALVSSLDRTSPSIGTDPWYLTTPGQDQNGPTNVVMRRRPALSCWQNDVWSYKGATSHISGLNSALLPGLDLSQGLQNLLIRYLSVPKIVTVASRLNPSSLQSTRTALGSIFDAGGSSIREDLQQLVLTAYIATVNTLTDTSLYGNRSTVENVTIPNEAEDKNNPGVPSPGVGDFTVYSPDIVTLSVKWLIVIPTVSLGSWALTLLLMHSTALSLTKCMEVTNLFRQIKAKHTHVNIHVDKLSKRATWHFHSEASDSTGDAKGPVVREENIELLGNDPNSNNGISEQKLE